MKRTVILLFLSLIGITQATACLNLYYSVDKLGNLHAMDDLHKPYNINFNLVQLELAIKSTEKRIFERGDYKLLSDYAVLLIKAGKTKESLEILSQLYLHYPNEYQIVSNLGTALELNDQLELALKFISKSIELYPHSHGGSEWVHVKILKAKIAQQKDSLYLINHSILDFANVDSLSLDIARHIEIQVRERFPFSPGPNPVMANLVSSLGDYSAQSSSIEFAKVNYNIAKFYFGAQGEELDNKINQMIQLRKEYAAIKPKQDAIEATTVKIGGIRYKDMLKNNNPQDYRISWDGISLDVDSLLSSVGLKRKNQLHLWIEDTLPSIDKEQMQAQVEEMVQNQNERARNLQWAISLIVLIFFGFFWLMKKKT